MGSAGTESYFDKRYQAFLMKFNLALKNENLFKHFHSLPNHLTAENLPLISMKLFEMFDIILVEIANIRHRFNLPAQVNVAFQNSKCSVNYDSKDDISHSVDQNVPQKKKVTEKIEKRPTSTLHAMPQ